MAPSASVATAECPPLLRLAWNKQDSNYIATFQSDASSVLILDIRVPAVPVAELSGHSGPLNSIAWAPHSSGHLCSTGDDGQALIWDVTHMTKSKVIQDPILAYGAPSEVNQLAWNSSAPEWVSIAFGNTVQALRV
jgi:WD repeat-containing protein 68